MPLWSNTDANTSAPIFAPAQVNLAPTEENRDLLYGNTTPDVFVEGSTIGLFGVDNNEVVSRKDVSHAGWILRTEGSGGRAGRVIQETLVAMGSITDDAEDDAIYPDAVISITQQPVNVSVVEGNDAEFTMQATSVPEATLSFEWFGPDGTISGATTNALTVEDVELANDASEYYVTVSVAGGASVDSANAVLTVVAPTVEITQQPQDEEATEGDNVTFTVAATTNSDLGLEYQWYNAVGDVELVGETADTLFLENVQIADSGNAYYVAVSSGSTTVQSANATLTVQAI
jgi:hypothetical protein